MKLSERAATYSLWFPERPPLHCVGERWIEGVWMEGNNYRRKQEYHGEFPPSTLQRIHTLFPDLDTVLFPFAGVTCDPGALHVDLTPDVRPDLVADAHQLPLRDSCFDLAIADPPYTKEDAARYGHRSPNKRLVLAELCRVVRPGGFVVWLDVRVPVYANRRCRFVGLITLYLGSNRKLRGLSLFEVQ